MKIEMLSDGSFKDTFSEITRIFNKNGLLHCDNGPAVFSSITNFKCWYINGQRHRTDGPAIEYANGDKFWYLNGQLHRIDGPAVEYEDHMEYWYKGINLSEKEYFSPEFQVRILMER